MRQTYNKSAKDLGLEIGSIVKVKQFKDYKIENDTSSALGIVYYLSEDNFPMVVTEYGVIGNGKKHPIGIPHDKIEKSAIKNSF